MSVIDDYAAGFSGRHRELLDELIALIRSLVPAEAGEKISWNMPTFTLNGNLVHVAPGKAHVGFYPGAAGVEFAKPMLDELGLKYSKGAIQFPLSKALPREVVERVVAFRIEQQTGKAG